MARTEVTALTGHAIVAMAMRRQPSQKRLQLGIAAWRDLHEMTVTFLQLSRKPKL